MKRLALVFTLLFLSDSALAENFSLPNDSGQITVKNVSPEETKVIISSPSITERSKVYTETVIAPSRILIDITPKLNLSKDLLKFPLEETGLFSRVRVGTTNKKTRLVLDFHVLDAPTKNLSVIHNLLEKQIEVLIAAPGLKTSVIVTPTATALPTGVVTATIFPTQEPKASETPISIVTAQPTSTPFPVSSIKSKINTLERISFDKLTNAVVVNLTNPVNYQLTKTTSDKYSLLLEEVSAADQNLLLEQFPPLGFLGFQAIALTKSEKGILIEIYVEDGFHPEAGWNENVLNVRAVQK